MKVRMIPVSVVLVIGLLNLTTTAGAVDDLYMTFTEHYIGGRESFYYMYFWARKTDATTSKLTTPNGTYACHLFDGWFSPEVDFWSEHQGGITEFRASISGGWTVTFDEGPEQTVAVIDFGAIDTGDFAAVPIITYPADDTVFYNPDPNPFSITWEFGSEDPCQFPSVRAKVYLFHSLGDEMSTMPTCDTTSYKPPFALFQDSWSVSVECIRYVTCGLTITEGSWAPPSPGVELTSFDGVGFEVVPVHTMSFGQMKALYQ